MWRYCWVTLSTMGVSSDDQDKKWLSVNQTAAMLGVSPSTVRNWAAEGKITEHRTQGGHRRFDQDEINEFARAMTHGRGNPKILVVDDDATIRYIIAEAFKTFSLDVIEAESGLLGLDALDRDPPALVLLDIMMPGLDGFQVMEYLAQFGVKIPVIVMSALGEQAEAKAREVGADDFVAKPFDIMNLVQRCRRLVA